MRRPVPFSKIPGLAIAFIGTIIAHSLFGQSQHPEASPTASASPSATPIVFSEQTLADLKRLREAALTSDYAFKQVAHLANNIGPRLSGSAQAAEAVKYVAGEMKALGCEIQLEKVMVPHWVRGIETAELTQFPGQTQGTRQKIVLCALGGSVATPPAGIDADAVSVRDFEELKSLPRDKVSGKIVLFNHPFDKQMAAQGRGGDAYGQAVVYRSDGPVAAASLGAVACLIRSVGGADYRLPHTGQTNYKDGVAKIPAAAVTAEDADLIAYLTDQGQTRMHLVLTPQTLPDVESANVIADLRGSEHPDQVVILSGHLDSWDLGTGAIDDGAGVAVAMETAHLIQQLHLKPKRTIRVIAWMNEENGSRGSKQYEKDHAGEFGNHFAVNETDLGAGHPVGLNLRTKPEVKKMFEPVAKILEEIGAGTLSLAEHVGSDTDPIEKAGVPAFSPMQDSRFYFNYHHAAADTMDKIVPRELQENAAVVAVAAYAFANIEQSLPR
jgi:Zn-dependent M28 family amino/carboxypeptidase